MRMSTDRKHWLIVTIVCGVAASLCYWLSTGASLPFKWAYLLFFGFGPFLIAAVYGIYNYLKHDGDSIALQFATLFLIASGLAFTFMATMQGTIRGQHRQHAAALEDDAAKDSLRTVVRSVDSTQQGLDMAFDIFISTGTFLLGVALLGRKRFGWIFALPAMVIGAGGLTLNAASFPTINAGDAGYFDPGPFYGLFYIALTGQLVWVYFREKQTPATA